jgi:hypothetical protein
MILNFHRIKVKANYIHKVKEKYAKSTLFDSILLQE